MHAHEVYVAKFGEVTGGTQAQYFLNRNAPAGCDDQPGQLDFCVWVIRTPGADIVVDAGFTSSVAKRRGRPHFREPSEAVALLGVDVPRVSHVILSHFHYDHTGDLDPFTSARVVAQEAEMRFWTGRHAWRPEFRRLAESEDIERLVRLNLDGRVDLVNGAREVVPGVKTHRVGGHTPGTQIVSVETAQGVVVLASDSSHLQAHVETGMPANLLTDLPEMYDAFDTINSLASSPDLVIPGHDPEVLRRFKALPGLEGIAARIA
jgi:glyoxylase-like metal-dependent hydrolase (beta-lactamase superfamily II)